MSVSIIIPVYNAEQYIDECLKSILTQTYTDYEIILVDDGSKDKSPDICDDYAKKYENIRSLHEVNSGPSTARNWGLQEAKGDYIIFVDSDDFWMESDNLMTLMNHPALKSPSFEVLEFNRVRYMPSSKSYVNFPKFPEFLLEPHNINQVIPELVGKGLFPMSPCTKVMKKDFLLRNNIKFIEGIISEECVEDDRVVLFLILKISLHHCQLIQIGEQCQVLSVHNDSSRSLKRLSVVSRHH